METLAASRGASRGVSDRLSAWVPSHGWTLRYTCVGPWPARRSIDCNTPERFATDVEVDLVAGEGEASAELEQGILQPIHEGSFDVSFQRCRCEVEELENVRIPGELLGEIGLGDGELVCEAVRPRQREGRISYRFDRFSLASR